MKSDLERMITELEDYELEVYVMRKTAKERAITAGFVLLGLAAWGLAIVSPLWWQRALCAAAYLIVSFVFDATSRLRRAS